MRVILAGIWIYGLVFYVSDVFSFLALDIQCLWVSATTDTF